MTLKVGNDFLAIQPFDRQNEFHWMDKYITNAYYMLWNVEKKVWLYTHKQSLSGCGVT